MKKLGLTVLAFSLMVPALSAHADNAANPTAGQFAQNHPRRAEVNKRVKNQRGRINKDVKDGKLNATQAQQLKSNDKAIKAEEHADVKANGGYLTKAQQGQINQEENANSKLIKDEANPK